MQETNDKAQSPKDKNWFSMIKDWFWHLSIWILFVIWTLTFGICWSNYKNMEVKNEDI